MPKKNDPAIFDPHIILENLMDEKELAVKIIKGFLLDIPNQIKALDGYLENKSSEDAERQAHTIKGAAANVGGKALQSLAYKMEKAGEAGNLEAVKMDMPELKTQFEKLKKAMEPVLLSWEDSF